MGGSGAVWVRGMNGQLTIFDLLPQSTPNINDISEEEAVRIVGERLGIVFVRNPKSEQWEGKNGKLKLSLEYDHFCLDDNQDLFLGAGYTFGTSGGGSPCSGIDGAVKYLKAKLEKYGRQNKALQHRRRN